MALSSSYSEGELDLRAELESFRLSTLKEIDNLKSEVQHLKHLLNEKSNNCSHCCKSTETESPTVAQEKKKTNNEQKEKNSWWKKEDEVVDSITYDEAWESLGGDAELAKYVDQSREIQSLVKNAAMEHEIKLLLSSNYANRKSYSTALINQSYCATLDELYQQANKVYADFDAAINGLAEATHGRAVVPPMKGSTRARMKALFKYRDDGLGQSNDEERVAWYRLTDLVRGTIEYDTIADLYSGIEALIQHFGRENVCEVNDRYIHPLTGGYRDIQCSIRFNGHVCELQLNTEPMLRAKMTTGHRDFEVIRELKAAVVEGDLVRVMNALEFGREHLGTAHPVASDSDAKSPLTRLLQSESARTLLHTAASKGSASIVHALLLYGADPDAQNKDGDTALHLAVFGGYERCVWVLLDVGNASLTVKNNDGETPFVKGYLLIWKQPTESAIRAVTTLAHRAGAAAAREARETVHQHVKRKQFTSSLLVDYAADGRIAEMKNELQNFADPDSTRDGKSALVSAISNHQFDAVKVLLDFNAKTNMDLLLNLSAQNEKVQEILSYICKERMIPHVELKDGIWSNHGVVAMTTFEEGVCAYTDRNYVWKHVPYYLTGALMALNRCHTLSAELSVSVTQHNATIAVLVPWGVAREYGSETKNKFEEQLKEFGFLKTELPSMINTSFPGRGANLWHLSPRGEETSSRPIEIKTNYDTEFNICILPKLEIPKFEIKVLDGGWGPGCVMNLTPLVDGVVMFTDRNYTWTSIPSELLNVPMTLNPCHTGCGLKIQVSNLDNLDASFGILIAKPTEEYYEGSYYALVEKLAKEGYTKKEFPKLFSNSPPANVVGADLWCLPINGLSSAIISVDKDMEFNICYFSSV